MFMWDTLDVLIAIGLGLQEGQGLQHNDPQGDSVMSMDCNKMDEHYNESRVPKTRN
jgi:hypothetical protein